MIKWIFFGWLIKDFNKIVNTLVCNLKILLAQCFNIIQRNE